MAQRQTLPVLPLRGTVIFPGLTAPIAAGRPGTLRAIESALRGDRLVFAVAQRDNTDEPSPEILYSMGVIAKIGQVQRGLGGVQLLLQGEQRATALQYTQTDNYLSAVIMPVEEMSPIDEHDAAFEAQRSPRRPQVRRDSGRFGLRPASCRARMVPRFSSAAKPRRSSLSLSAPIEEQQIDRPRRRILQEVHSRTTTSRRSAWASPADPRPGPAEIGHGALAERSLEPVLPARKLSLHSPHHRARSWNPMAPARWPASAAECSPSWTPACRSRPRSPESPSAS